jgi:hypothetical protein
MRPAIACAPASEPAAALLAGYTTHLARTDRGNIGYQRGARAFLTRWPDPRSWAACRLRRGWPRAGRPGPSWCF